MDNGYSLSDISAATGGMNGLGGENALVTLLLLFALISGGGFGWGNNRDFGQYATAASQQEILFGQQFQNLGSMINKVGDGISSLGYSQLQQMDNNTASINGNVVNEGRGIQTQLADCCCTTNRNIDSVRFDMANYSSAIQANDTANTQKILDALAQNKIESLQSQINALQMQNAMAGVVRYPMASTYTSGVNPFCACGCGCAQ